MYRGQKKIFLPQLQVSIYFLTSDLFCFTDECFCLCIYICGACLVFKVARRGRQIPRNRSYSRL